MKRLKCESCGADIEVDENKEFGKCPFCKTKYQLNETKNVVIKVDESAKEFMRENYDRMEKFVKPPKIVMILFSIFFVCLLGFVIFGIFGGIKEGAELDKNYEIHSFNGGFEVRKGTQTKTGVSYLIDDIVTNNKTDKRKIEVVFGEVDTKDPEEIAAIKKDLKDDFSAEYEVSFDYDDKGFINKVTIVENETNMIDDMKEKMDSFSE